MVAVVRENSASKKMAVQYYNTHMVVGSQRGRESTHIHTVIHPSNQIYHM